MKRLKQQVMTNSSKQLFNLKNKEIYFVIAIFVFAFVLRFIYLNQIQKSPLFDTPIMDAKYNDDWAQRIATGEELEEKVFFRAPLYPYFLAGVYTIFGHSYFWARLIQFIIGSLSCVLIFFIGRKVFNRTVGLISGFLAGGCGIFIYFEGELLIPFLIVFLNLLLVWSLLFFMEKPDFKKSLLSGILLGLSAIARPNILLVAIAFFFWMLFLIKSTRGYKTALGYAFSFALGVVLVVSPVTLRNYIKGHDLVLISSQGGVNFYIGNNPRSDGVWAGLREVGKTWDNVYEGAFGFAEQSMGRKLKPSEVSQFWTSKSLEFIRDQPTNFLRLMFKKFLYFWNGKELPNNKDLYFFARTSGLLNVLIWKKVLFFPFGVLAPLALMGIILSFKKTKKVIPLLIFIFMYMLSVILFFVNSRFRVPVLPFLIIFGSYFLYWFYLQIKKSRFSSVIFLILGVMILGVLINSSSFRATNLDYSLSHNKIGLAYSQKGKLPEAVEQFELALNFKPDNTAAHLNLGLTLMSMGRYNQAIDELQTVLKFDGEKDRVHYNLGVAYHQIGKLEKAIEHYNASLSINDRNPKAHNNLGSIYVQLQKFKKAVEEFKSALRYLPDSYESHFNLGVAYSNQQKYQEAIKEFITCTHLKNDFPDSYYNLGIIYKKLGRKQDAITAFKNFLRLRKVKDQHTESAEKSLKELEGKK